MQAMTNRDVIESLIIPSLGREEVFVMSVEEYLKVLVEIGLEYRQKTSIVVNMIVFIIGREMVEVESCHFGLCTYMPALLLSNHGIWLNLFSA